MILKYTNRASAEDALFCVKHFYVIKAQDRSES